MAASPSASNTANDVLKRGGTGCRSGSRTNTSCTAIRSILRFEKRDGIGRRKFPIVYQEDENHPSLVEEWSTHTGSNSPPLETTGAPTPMWSGGRKLAPASHRALTQSHRQLSREPLVQFPPQGVPPRQSTSFSSVGRVTRSSAAKRSSVRGARSVSRMSWGMPRSAIAAANAARGESGPSRVCDARHWLLLPATYEHTAWSTRSMTDSGTTGRHRANRPSIRRSPGLLPWPTSSFVREPTGGATAARIECEDVRTFRPSGCSLERSRCSC